MLENIASQPVWIQSIFGLFAFFGIIWILSIIATTVIGGLEDWRYSKYKDARIRRENQDLEQREQQLSESSPSVLEEALFVAQNRTRTIQEIREYINSLQPAARESIAKNPRMEKIIAQIEEKRSNQQIPRTISPPNS